jgi:7 transmembrane sweet-taste receptor of 3 GCPR
MAAIHRIMRASKRLRHVVVNRRALVGAVLCLCAVTLTLLLSMTLMDPPKLSPEYILTDIVNGARETVVLENCYCRSKSNVWLVISVTWHLALLLVATIQAVLTRNVRQELNDSRTLAFMIYSQFIFVLLQLATLFIRDDLLDSERASARSILYSLDCIVTVSLYFVPKLISKDEEIGGSDEMVGSSTVKKLRMLAAIASAQHDRQMHRLHTEREPLDEQGLAEDSNVQGHHEGGPASERFSRHIPRRLSIPCKEFEAHLHDVDSATSLTNTNCRTASQDTISETPS